MLKKKILLMLFIFSILFIGITYVSAYDYKAGDLVEIPNPNGESQQFYVVAGKVEKQKMLENYCKDPTRNNETICSGANVEVDTNYSYGEMYEKIPDDMLILVSKNAIRENLVFDNSITSDSIFNPIYDNRYNNQNFKYIIDMIESNNELSIANDWDGFLGNYLELLYSKNDDVVYSNSGVSTKIIQNIPEYLQKYKNAYLEYHSFTDLRTSEYYIYAVKIDDYSNGNITLSSKTTKDYTISGDDYLCIVMKESNINLIQESTDNSATNNSNSVSETTVQKQITNPKTSDMNIYIALLVIGLFTGIIIVSSKRLKKIK